MRASAAINVVAIVVVLMLWLLPQNVLAGGPAPFVLPAQIELRYTANLRTGPGVTFPVKRVAGGGERLPVLACNATCDWYLVETDGWVAAFLTAPVRVISHVPTPLPTPLPTPVAVPAPVSKATAPALESIELSLPLITGREVAIDPNGTRVRFDTFIYRGPGTNYRFADYTARQGQPITVVGRNSLGNWYVLVSGDWIAAAAIVNAPANLPIAWEPPPPPDGPERIGPRPVPAEHIEPQASSPTGETVPIVVVPSATHGCVDINTASLEQLRRIKHIDENRAQQILRLRSENPFSSVGSMTRISGIADVRLADIKAENLACVR